MSAPKQKHLINSMSGFESQERHAPESMSRRESLKWLGLLVAGSSAAAGEALAFTPFNMQDKPAIGHWPSLKLAPVSAKGYGQDPNLIMPPSTPWSLIMSASEIALTANLCELIAPREASIPSAKDLNVMQVINEWVSAPYARQQNDRVIIMHCLAWIDDEAQLRFKRLFTECSELEQRAIIDDIAYTNKEIPAQFKRPAEAFSRLRELVLAAFFTTPVGMKDIGYVGNVPIHGDYPGPSKEAYLHLDVILDELDLTAYKYEVQ